MREDLTEENKGLQEILDPQDKIDAYNKKYGKHAGGKGLVKDMAKGAGQSVMDNVVTPASNHATKFKAFLGGAAENLPSMIIPKPAQEIGKFYQDMAKKGGDGSDEYKAAQTAIDEAHKDRRKEAIESGIVGLLQKAKNKGQEQKMQNVIIQNATLSSLQLKNEAQSTFSKMNGYYADMNNESLSQQKRDLAQQRFFAAEQSLASKGIMQGEHYSVDVNGKFSLNEGVKLGIDPDVIKDAFKKVTKNWKQPLSDDAMKELVAEVMKGATDSQAREFEKIIQKAISQMNNAKG